MSLFENISFINEGEQAEEYKARKAKEKEEAEKKDKERFLHRYASENKTGSFDPGNRNSYYDTDDMKRNRKVRDISQKDSMYHKRKSIEAMVDRDRKTEFKEDLRSLRSTDPDTKDAINRHIRRHPDQYKESGIFESVQFINE